MSPTTAVSMTVGTVRTVKQGASFLSPSGRIACFFSRYEVSCETSSDTAWTPPPQEFCTPARASFFILAETAFLTCAGYVVPETAALDGGDVTWRRHGDPTVIRDGREFAALPYGSSLVSGHFTCASAIKGVTCRNTATGHGFFMSRESYSIFGSGA